MSTESTRGPWGVRYAKNLTAITTEQGEIQLSLHGVSAGLKPWLGNIQEWESNTRLISAAPELLSLVYTYWQTRSEERWEREEPEIHAMIKAVVKKATG
jgi:hypothetical protein